MLCTAFCPAKHGREMLKQVRSLLIETAPQQIDSMIQLIISVKVVNMHHDISTVIGEQVVTLSEPPSCPIATN